MIGTIAGVAGLAAGAVTPLALRGVRALREAAGPEPASQGPKNPSRDLLVRPVTGDLVEISPQGAAAAAAAGKRARSGGVGAKRAGETSTRDGTSVGPDGRELTPEQDKQVEKLKKNDREVRAHEAAHKAAAGAHGGGASFTYQTGPDGKRYAVGGEVPIDVSPVKGDPRATIAKMQQVRRAALAPAQPSGQDRQVAAQAARVEAEARAELARQRAQGSDEAPNGTASAAALGRGEQDQPQDAAVGASAFPAGTQPGSHGVAAIVIPAHSGAIPRASESTARSVRSAFNVFTTPGRLIDVRI